MNWLRRLFQKYRDRTDHALKLQTPRPVFTGYDADLQAKALKAHQAKLRQSLKPRSKKTETATVVPFKREKAQ